MQHFFSRRIMKGRTCCSGNSWPRPPLAASRTMQKALLFVPQKVDLEPSVKLNVQKRHESTSVDFSYSNPHWCVNDEEGTSVSFLTELTSSMNLKGSTHAKIEFGV